MLIFLCNDYAQSVASFGVRVNILCVRIASYVLYCIYALCCSHTIQSEHQNYIDSTVCTAILYALAMDLIVYSALECLVA